MTYPKIKPCPKCGNEATELYGYGDVQPLNWHVECDDCQYLGPCGNKLQAIRLHNLKSISPAPAATSAASITEDVSQGGVGSRLPEGSA